MNELEWFITVNLVFNMLMFSMWKTDTILNLLLKMVFFVFALGEAIIIFR